MCDQHFRQSPNHLEALVFPSWNPTKPARWRGGGHQRLRWELEPASCQHTEQENSITSLTGGGRATAAH